MFPAFMSVDFVNDGTLTDDLKTKFPLVTVKIPDLTQSSSDMAVPIPCRNCSINKYLSVSNLLEVEKILAHVAEISYLHSQMNHIHR
jgi:hypothetical protein